MNSIWQPYRPLYAIAQCILWAAAKLNTVFAWMQRCIVQTSQPCEKDRLQSEETAETYGLLKSERDERRAAFIKSILLKDVRRVASYYHMDVDCDEFRKAAHGSFNVCFFLSNRCDDKKCIVRLPIVPLLHNPWLKVQREVAVMRYIKQKTTIPIPQIYGYGSGDETTNPTGWPYIVEEYVQGQQLDPSDLLKTASSANFYSQLADILAQLRMQTFDCAGSIIMDDKGEYTVMPASSIDLNMLRRDDAHPSTYKSVAEFADANYQVLADRVSEPLCDLDEEEARHEVFALQDFKTRLSEFVDTSDNVFVLTHGDLRPPNIIVSDDLKINAIIDWEWSCTIPRQFFIPPTWFAGSDVPVGSDCLYATEYSKFHKSLTSQGSPASRILATEWGPNLASSLDLFIPATLSHENFVYLYYVFLFPEFYKNTTRQEKVRRFFEEDASGIFSAAVRNKLEAAKAYMVHLQEKGLLEDLS